MKFKIALETVFSFQQSAIERSKVIRLDVLLYLIFILLFYFTVTQLHKQQTLIC